MTEQKLEFANKLKTSIEKTKKILSSPISLSLVVNYAKEQADVIGYLNDEQVDRLKNEVREALKKELEEMTIQFEKL